MKRQRFKSKPNQGFRPSKGVYVVLIIGVLLAVYLTWFFANHHQVTRTIYTPTPEARQNRYLAARELLGDKAVVLQGLAGRDELLEVFGSDATQRTVILYQVSHSQKAHLDTMLAWVMLGGHLIVANQHSLGDTGTSDDEHQSEQNPLLFKLGIDYQQYSSQEWGKSSQFVRVPLRLPSGELLALEGDDGRFVLSADFYQTYPKARVLDYHFFVKEGEKYRPKQPIGDLSIDETTKLLGAVDDNDKPFDPKGALLDIELGQGRLTVMHTPKLFINPKTYPNIVELDENEVSQSHHSHTWQLLTNTLPAKEHDYHGNIASASHASLLSYLTNKSHTVYLVPDIESVGFFELIWRYLMWSVIGLVATIGLALLALPKPFGITKVYKTDVSHNIFGFFAHVGRYLWASDEASALLKHNRHNLIQTIIAKEQLGETTPQTLIVSVCQKTGLSAGLVHDALYQEWQNQGEFLRIGRSFAQLARHYGDWH